MNEKNNGELLEVSQVQEHDGSVLITFKIERREFADIFGGYEFKKRIEYEVMKKIVDAYPIEEINKIMAAIDTNAIAKGVMVDLISQVSRSRE